MVVGDNVINIPEQVQGVGDVSSIGILGLVWVDILPTVASLVTIVWLSLQCYILVRDKIVNNRKKKDE